MSVVDLQFVRQSSNVFLPDLIQNCLQPHERAVRIHLHFMNERSATRSDSCKDTEPVNKRTHRGNSDS